MPCALRRGGEPRRNGVVAVEDRGAARAPCRRRSRPWRRRSPRPREEAEMRRLDRGDDRHVRAHQPRQRVDLAGMVHAHLEHAALRVARHARQRQRHAPMVVEAAGRGDGAALALERALQRLLGSGLADAAGDADDLRRRCAARAARPSASSAVMRIADDQQRRVRATPGGSAPPAPRRRPWRARRRRNRGRRNSVRRARRRDRRRATRAAVDRDAARGPVARVRAPPVAAAASAEVQSGVMPARLPSSATASRARRHRRRDGSSPPTIWPLLVALAGDQQHVAGLQHREAARMASRAVADLARARGSAARMARRITAGSSLRGLSSVTMTTSARPRGDLAHLRPLAGVAVAAAAEHDDEPAAAMGAQRRRAPSRARRAYARNRRSPARHWRGSPHAAAGRARPAAAAARRGPLDRRAGGEGKTERRQRIARLECPDQRQEKARRSPSTRARAPGRPPAAGLRRDADRRRALRRR